MTRASKAHEKLYGIGAVARLTGLSVHTLRVWERRHGVVELARTEGGRRLYTGDDVERLSLLRRLVDRGETIGRIATLSRDELGERLGDFERRASERMDEDPAGHRIGVLGDFLGLALEDKLGKAEIVVRANRPERFLADVRQARPDALLVEVPIVTTETRRMIAKLRRDGDAARIVVVYGFARRADAKRLAQDCEAVLRAPVSLDELERALAALPPATPRPAPERAAEAAPAPDSAGQPPKRRFTRSQLARLALQPSSVACECPHHLVELIERLSVFEDYSADCENRNRDDAALHAYLHATTASARALIEDALDRVVESEQLDPGPP